MREKWIIVGIDPGANGYLCVRSSDSVTEFHPMPYIKNEFDLPELQALFSKLARQRDESGYKVSVVMERVQPIFGSSAAATFKFGFGFGLLQGLIAAHSFPFLLVPPKEWMKEMWTGVIPITKKVNGKEKTDTKSTSYAAARRLFPEIDFRKSERAKNFHDGKVDACLICEFGKRKWGH